MSQQLEGIVKGLHHITLVTSNQELNRRFYTEVLGLRRVKYSVNQDDVFHRHLFYADDKGTTGSAMTFFEWPELPKGRVGLGSPHHLAYSVKSIDALPQWKAWLGSQGVSVAGPYARDGRVSLYLKDPDGVNIEITHSTDDGEVSQAYLKELDGDLPTTREIRPEMHLVKFNHATPVADDPSITVKFFDKTLGLKNPFTKKNPDQPGTSILAIGNEEQPDFLRYIVSDRASRGLVGIGNVHHIAMAVADDGEQLKILKKLEELGVRNSGIIDRFWFHSLYFRDPHGNLLEIATKGPGYTRDEPLEKLGSSLILPPWEEPRRTEIENFLKDTDSKNPLSWPPKYPAFVSPPESLPVANGSIVGQPETVRVSR